MHLTTETQRTRRIKIRPRFLCALCASVVNCFSSANSGIRWRYLNSLCGEGSKLLEPRHLVCAIGRPMKNTCHYDHLLRILLSFMSTKKWPALLPTTQTSTRKTLILIPTSTQRLVHIHHGMHLLHFGVNQLKPRLQGIALGKQHFHIVCPRGLKQAGGNIN